MTKKERLFKKAFKIQLRRMEPVILNKLLANERKYHFGSAWKVPDWKEWLWHDLPQHVLKGDPRDVVIYGFFAWYHGWPTSPPNGLQRTYVATGNQVRTYTNKLDANV
jgi:hypothetical protein